MLKYHHSLISFQYWKGGQLSLLKYVVFLKFEIHHVSAIVIIHVNTAKYSLSTSVCMFICPRNVLVCPVSYSGSLVIILLYIRARQDAERILHVYHKHR